MPTATGSPSSGRCSVSTSARQRNLVPVQLRRAHVDRGQPVAGVAPRSACPRSVRSVSAVARRSRPSAAARRSGWRCRRRRPASRRRSRRSAARRRLGVASIIGELVEAHAAVPVAERARQRGRHHGRRPRWSMTTKSLPSPCIFRKGRPAGGAGSSFMARHIRRATVLPEVAAFPPAFRLDRPSDAAGRSIASTHSAVRAVSSVGRATDF